MPHLAGDDLALGTAHGEPYGELHPGRSYAGSGVARRGARYPEREYDDPYCCGHEPRGERNTRTDG